MQNQNGKRGEFVKEKNRRSGNGRTLLRLLHGSWRYFIACILAGLVIGYNNFLNWVYHKEQELKLSKQSAYYYLDTFGDTLLQENRIQIRDITVKTATEPEDETATFYQKIHQYHVNQTIAGEGGADEQAITD